MIRLVVKTEDHPSSNSGDCDIIVRACADRGYLITKSDAYAAWNKYSDSMAAGWLIVDKYEGEGIVEIVRCQCDEIEEEENGQ